MKAVKAVYGEENVLHSKDDDIEEKLQKLENKGKRKVTRLGQEINSDMDGWCRESPVG